MTTSTMKTWTFRSPLAPNAPGAVEVCGETIEQALRANAHNLARGRVGNAAGHRLLRIRAEYTCTYSSGHSDPNNKGWVRIVIESLGLDLAHQKASDHISTAELSAEAIKSDLPDPIVIEFS